MLVNPTERFVYFSDFGAAIRYCHDRVWIDLIPPEERGSDEAPEEWRRVRAQLDPHELADKWRRASATLDKLYAQFLLRGYTAELADRLREVVNATHYDLELGEIYGLPGDARALLAAIQATPDALASFNFSADNEYGRAASAEPGNA